LRQIDGQHHTKACNNILSGFSMAFLGIGTIQGGYAICTIAREKESFFSKRR